MSPLRLSLLLSVGLACACESEPAKKTADGKAKSAEKNEKNEEPAKDTVPAKKAEKHFDLSKDESGVLARSAAALEADEALDSKALRELSHHAEKLPSVQALCKKLGELDTVSDQAACTTQTEHHLVLIGPEIYAEWAACVMEATDADAVTVCDEAEAEAEALLHEKPHGEGLSKEDCTGLFEKFEKLAMDDAGEHAEHVKEVLEEVRDDVVTSCVDQGTKAELDCATKSETLDALSECASSHL